jgi:hypothetical protein
MDDTKPKPEPRDCLIALDQGDYWQDHQGYDWGRTNKTYATRLTRTEAERLAEYLRPFGARVERED